MSTESTRRGFFTSFSGGLMGAGLASLLARDVFDAGALRAAEHPVADSDETARRVHDMTPRPAHFEPKARSVIHLFMNGGPSQMDLFDPKETLTKHHGKPYFGKIAAEVENPKAAGALMRSPFEFKRRGRCGMWVSDVMPHFAEQVDDVAMILSLQGVNVTHEPSLYKIQSGRQLPGFPSLGSWVTYGLGSENEDLPGYVVLDDPRGLPINGVENWQSGFLPPVYQGTRFRSSGAPVLNLRSEAGQPAAVVELERDLIGRLNRIHRRERAGFPDLDARISSYELAARMQLSASDALDVSSESAKTRELYGLDQKVTESYGRRCLIARRLVERGVRFVQIFIDGQIWDNHSDLEGGLKSCCARTDRPVAGLLRDLRRRGLLDSTLVVWGGEFGRLPIAQLRSGKMKGAGRDHNKNAAVTWMAGAGIRPGTVYGATDELGFSAVDNPVSVQDWHATILHLLGLRHDALVHERDGLEEKLTHVFETRVVEEILA